MSDQHECGECRFFIDLGKNQWTCPYIASGDTSFQSDALDTCSDCEYFELKEEEKIMHGDQSEH